MHYVIPVVIKYLKLSDNNFTQFATEQQIKTQSTMTPETNSNLKCKVVCQFKRQMCTNNNMSNRFHVTAR